MSVDALRQAIDELDAKLVALFNERASLAKQIGALKDDSKYMPGREADVLRRAKKANEGPLGDEEVARILRELMSACLRLESPLRVAYLGPEGTYSEDAAARFFGDSATLAPCASIGAVFGALESGEASHAIVPVENSYGGVVADTLQRFVGSRVKICGEVMLPIAHCLLSDGDFDVIHAHPQAFAQCRSWLDAHHPGVPCVPAPSNAAAAQLAAAEGGAAIASERCADLYDLSVVARAIADARNETRFLALGLADAEPTGADRTSIVVAARNKPGALRELLTPFAASNVNVARIQSLPAPDQPWQDHFFLDLDGHRLDLDDELAQVAQNAAYYACLGSYPAAAL